MSHESLPFYPLLGVTSGFWQTVLGSFGLPLSDPPSAPFVVSVSDGDHLCCLDSTPPNWKPDQPTHVLLHGLGGSSRSRYMVRLSRYLYSKGQRVVRMNLRGCGLGEGLARLPSHAGRSADLFAVCKALKAQFPDSKLKIIGFSLAGNITLKMLGELGGDALPLVEKAIVICPAVDLKAGVEFIAKPENRFFEKFYLDCLLETAAQKRVIYPDYPHVQFPDPLNLYTFDDLYTAPLCGFRDAEDYYLLCSSSCVVHQIEVPTTILYALDDPVIPAHTIAELTLPPNVTAYATKYGGHVSYLSWAGLRYGLRWMDRKVMEWLQ